MKSLKEFMAVVEATEENNENDKREELKDDETAAKEAEEVDIDEIDIDEEGKNLEESLCGESLTLENALVAMDVINVSCCEAYIYEASSKKRSELEVTLEGTFGDIWEKIKAFFRKLWNKVVGFYNKVKMYVLSMFMSGEKFIKKYKSEIESKLSTLSSREIEMDIYILDKDLIDDEIKKLIKPGSDVLKKCIDTINNLKNFSNDQIKEMTKALKKLEKTNEKCEEVLSKIEEDALGVQQKVILTSSMVKTEMNFILTGREKVMKSFNEYSNKVTNAGRKLEDACNKAKSNIKDDDKQKGKFLDIISVAEKQLTFMNSVMAKFTRMITKVNNKRLSQAVLMCRKVLGSSGTKEGYEFGSSSSTSLLESVMNVI